MTRIRLPVGRSLFFVAMLLFVLVALLPLRLGLSWFGLDARGLAAREASGSLWLGALKEAQLGPVPLGDVEASLNTLPLLLGRARFTLARHDAEAPFEGAVTISRHGFGFDDVAGRLRLVPGAAPLPIASLELDSVSAGFASGLCTRAEGRVQAALGGELGSLVPGGLTGSLRCAGGAVLLPLVSRSGMEQAQVRLFADGRYRIDLIVRAADEIVRQRLVAAGFRPVGNGFALRFGGRF